MAEVNRKLIEEVIEKIGAKLLFSKEPNDRLQQLHCKATHLLAIEAAASWHPDWHADLRKIKAEVER